MNIMSMEKFHEKVTEASKEFYYVDATCKDGSLIMIAPYREDFEPTTGDFVAGHNIYIAFTGGIEEYNFVGWDLIKSVIESHGGICNDSIKIGL